MGGKGFGDGEPLGRHKGISLTAPERQPGNACRLGRRDHEAAAIADQGLVAFTGPVPFEHGEFRVVQGAAFTVAEDMGEGEDPLLAGGKQLLAGKFGRGVQVEPVPAPIIGDEFGGEGADMGLVAGGDLQGGGIDLDEALRLEARAPGRDHVGAGPQEGPPVGMDMGAPPGRRRLACLPGGAGRGGIPGGGRRGGSCHSGRALRYGWRFAERSLLCGPLRNCPE